MIETIHEHSLETSLLRPGCTVLDVGCNGFLFGNAMRERFQANVFEVDINQLGPAQPYYRCGIAAVDGWGVVSAHEDSEARTIVSGSGFTIFTIASFSRYVSIPWWDVIKLDCEGSEYDILWNLEAPPAAQITVEFHQHTEARRSGKFMKKLLKRMGRWYDVRQHWLGTCENYWDSLFVLK